MKVWPQRLLVLLSLTRLSAISRLHKVTALVVQSEPATLPFSQSAVNCQTLKKKCSLTPLSFIRHCGTAKKKKGKKKMPTHLCHSQTDPAAASYQHASSEASHHHSDIDLPVFQRSSPEQVSLLLEALKAVRSPNAVPVAFLCAKVLMLLHGLFHFPRFSPSTPN